MSTKTKFIQSTGEFFHIYNRGVNKNEIFFSERNYLYFHQRMMNAHNPAAVEIIVYCLMPNHFHFILRQLQPSAISDFLKDVCDGYVKAINNERSRSGHLFEGKYKMKHINSDEYLLHLSRYIHLNPVRAKLVSSAEEWLYSSCREYYGLQQSKMVSTKVVLEQFGSSKEYRKFIEEYVPKDKVKIRNLLF